LSVFRYSGVGSRLNEGYTCLGTSSLLDSSDVCPRFLFLNFASLFPIKSGCGGAGREGTGLRPPEMLRGSWGRDAGCSCLLGGLAVEPLLLSSFNSGNEILLSLFTDRLLQISGRGGEGLLDIGLDKMFGVRGILCWPFLSFGGVGPVSESTPLSESLVL